MRNRALAVSILLVSAVSSWAQSNGGITLEPRSSVSVEFPGPVDDLYRSGASASAGVRLSPGRVSWLGFTLDLHYTMLALRSGNSFDLNMVGPEVGVDVRFSPLQWLAFQLRLAGGGGVAWARTDVLPYSDQYAAGTTARIGAGAVFQLGRLTLTAGADYHSFVNLSSSISIGLHGGWTIGGLGISGDHAEPLETRPTPLDESPVTGTFARPSLEQISIPPIFPVMRKYYSDHPIGTVIVANHTEVAIEGVVVTVNMPGFIDTPLPSARFAVLSPGQREEVALLAIFNDEVLAITESERVPATVAVDYTVGGSVSRVEEVIPVEFHDRNTLTWDDDRKVAMFVTARDPEVKMWAGNLSAAVTNQGNDAIDKHLQHAVMMHVAISAAGLAYGPDPATPYASISEDPFALDFVQFPFQTLSVRTGDCDDLSVLYATLLEAAGQATAFVLTPGHIFVAVRLHSDPDTAMRHYLAPEDLIVHNGQVWLPIEVTQVREDFLEAWAAGARQWRENVGHGNAVLIPVADAWQTYPSVAFSVARTQFTPPETAAVVTEFLDQLRRFTRREISTREVALQRLIEADPEDPRNYNRLGVLYARYGLGPEAERILGEPAAQEYPPALANRGNLAFLGGDFTRAEEYYGRALGIEPDSSAALLGLARVNHQKENYGLVREYYDQLEQANPEMALRYSYLSPRGDATARAAGAAELSSTVEWEEKP